MYLNNKILVGKNNKGEESSLLLNMMNRHGLITGASGSGKTITLKVIAESLSDAGVPVFLSDVKSDIAGCACPGEENENVAKRVEKLGLASSFEYKKYPVRFWDIYAKKGHPIRTKVSTVGPEILSIMLGLSEAQEGNLQIVFKIAEDENLELIDLKDLKSLLSYVADNKNNYLTTYGNITTQSIGVIQRSLLALENQGADLFFGEPSLDIKDFISTNEEGRGFLNILDAQELFTSTDLYASFMLWLLTELYKQMPEVGDIDKPNIVFFFDEAHLLFHEMPSYRLKKITQIVKLIRSKGIGLFFISQSPLDVPSDILGQLGNRIQHTLRAYTPAEQKVVKVAADSFRVNPELKTYDEILSLGTGEAVVSFQNEKGEPTIAQRVTILPPQSKMGTIDEMTRNKVINNSVLLGKYDEKIDNASAYEKVTEKFEEKKKEEEAIKLQKEEEKLAKEEEKKNLLLEKQKEKEAKELAKLEAQKQKEAEKKKKNDPVYKIGKKVTNKDIDKAINKGLNKVFKSLFK